MVNANASLPATTVTSNAPTAISTPIMSRFSDVAHGGNGGGDGERVRHDNELIKAIQVRIQQDEECDLWSTEGFDSTTKSPDICKYLFVFVELLN